MPGEEGHHKHHGHHHSKRRKEDPDISAVKIGFLGAGKMTESIIKGLIKHGNIDAGRIYVTAPTDRNLATLKALGVKTDNRNLSLFAKFDCDVVFLACHGSIVSKCYKEGGVRPQPLCVNYIPDRKHPIHVLSLISGFSIDKIKPTLLNPEHPDSYQIEMHRIMINCAVTEGAGICAVDCEPDSSKLSPLCRTLLSSIGTLEYVPESQMDAACALCGAGLAFSFYFIQAMANGAFKMGLSNPMSMNLASKTVQCAAQSSLESGKHPGELRDAVCAPKGAAIYGLHILDKAETSSGISAAVEAAHKRAQELAA